MNVKRYIAENEAEAMEKVKAELGRDAFILNTRRIRRKGLLGFFQKPLVEIVAAYEAPAPAGNPLPPLTPPTAKARDARAEQALTTSQGSLAGAGYAVGQGALAGVGVSKNSGSAAAVYTPSRGPAQYPSPQTAQEEQLRPALFSDVLTGQTVRAGEQEDVRIHKLENKIDALSTTLTGLAGKLQHAASGRGSHYSPEVESLFHALLDNEVHEEFAHKITREVSDIVQKQSVDAAEVMEQILKQYIGEPSPIRLRRFKRTVVMLVGPTGVGKTTTLAKLAAIYSINHHAKVGMITTDTYRIGAVEQLKTYAEILEIPLSVVYGPPEITDALREHEDKDIVFIDTAGKSPNDASHEAEIREFIKNAEVDEVHLVMSAATSFTGCLNVVNTYGFLRDYKLLFTKLDETPTWGVLLNVKFLTDRPASYMAAGQTVPDDIEVTNPRKIIKKLMESDTL